MGHLVQKGDGGDEAFPGPDTLLPKSQIQSWGPTLTLNTRHEARGCPPRRPVCQPLCGGTLPAPPIGPECCPVFPKRLLAGIPVKQLVFTREKHPDHGLFGKRGNDRVVAEE